MDTENLQAQFDEFPHLWKILGASFNWQYFLHFLGLVG